MEGGESEGGESLASSLSADPAAREKVRRLVASLPRKVAEIIHLVEARDIRRLIRAVNQLKADVAGCGFDSIIESAAMAETRLASGHGLDLTMGAVQSLIDLLRSVEGYDHLARNRAA